MSSMSSPPDMDCSVPDMNISSGNDSNSNSNHSANIVTPPAMTEADKTETANTTNTTTTSNNAVEQMVSQLLQYCHQAHLPCRLLTTSQQQSPTYNSNTSINNTSINNNSEEMLLQCCRQIRDLVQHLLAHKDPMSHSHAKAWQRLLVQTLQQRGVSPKWPPEVAATLTVLAAVKSQPIQPQQTRNNSSSTSTSTTPSQQSPTQTRMAQDKRTVRVLNADSKNTSGEVPNTAVVDQQQQQQQHQRRKYGSERQKLLHPKPPLIKKLEAETYQAICDRTPLKKIVKDPATGRRAIEQLCGNDVILGRGNSIQSFTGNEKFRMYVHQTKPE